MNVRCVGSATMKNFNKFNQSGRSAQTIGGRPLTKLMEVQQMPRVQLNGSVRTDSTGRILERSTLINVRCDDVLEATQLFNQLRARLNAPLENSNQERESIAKSPQYVKIEESGQCPECHSRLIRRSGKNGPFLGCSNYPDCRYTQTL